MRWTIVLAACSNIPPRPIAPVDNVVEVASFPATQSRDLDLLVQMDDSGSTAHFQIAFADAMPTLLDSLVIDGALVNLHVAVVTSDMGTNNGPAVGQVGSGGCAGVGRDGAFHGGLLVDEDDGAGGRTRSYTGTLPDALRSMLVVGSTGCGFEQPLAATRRALQRPDQAAFRRPDASLAVALVADEDDCSVLDPAFFDPNTPLGPLQSFRCTREGIACTEPLDSDGDKHDCVPREDSQYVEGIEPYEQFFATLAPPERFVLGGVIGDPTRVALEHRTINAESQLALTFSCEWITGPTGPAVADPPVRMAALVDSARSRGALTSVCQPDLTSNARVLGMAMKRSLGVACIDTSPLVQPLRCEVHDVDTAGIVTTIPECPADGTCYDIVDDDAACPETPDHARVAITRADPAAPGVHAELRCESR